MVLDPLRWEQRASYTPQGSVSTELTFSTCTRWQGLGCAVLVLELCSSAVLLCLVVMCELRAAALLLAGA